MFRKQHALEDEKKEDDEEKVSFLPSGTSKPITGNGNVNNTTINATQHNNGLLGYWYHRYRLRIFAVLAVAMLGIVIWMDERSAEFVSSPSGWSSGGSAESTVPIRKDKDGIIRFSCPSLDYMGINEGENFEDNYASVARNITSNKTEFLSTFRKAEFDGWGRSYTRIKKMSHAFKEKYYPKYLKEGSHLYESACGIGLNLYMTLEIIGEKRKKGRKPISGVTVYGNEYVTESVAKARDITLAEGVIPKGNRQGTICAGDSTNLSHVPSEAFDLVYSGYITPNMDLLNLYPDDPGHDDYSTYDDLCSAYMRFAHANGEDDFMRYKDEEGNEFLKKKVKKGIGEPKKNDWMADKLWKIMVQKQHDWYGQWVSEMARIAKPGVPVIAEQVSVPYCYYQSDWGGVLKEFWYEAADKNTYNWNIDPGSIEMMDDIIHPSRYHVFMLKNP